MDLLETDIAYFLNACLPLLAPTRKSLFMKYCSSSIQKP